VKIKLLQSDCNKIGCESIMATVNSNNIITYKAVFAGSGGCGKTTLVERLMGNRFSPKYVATLGVEVHPVEHQVDDSKNVVFNVWDTAGQERFGGLRDGYYINADVAVVYYELTSMLSYKEASNYVRDIRRVCDNIPILLVGNKDEIVDRTRAPKTKYHMSVKIDTFTEVYTDTTVTSDSLNGLLHVMYDEINKKSLGNAEAKCNQPRPSKQETTHPCNKESRQRRMALFRIEKQLTEQQRDEYYKFREDKLRELLNSQSTQ
jgi:small GTP-binding protein